MNNYDIEQLGEPMIDNLSQESEQFVDGQRVLRKVRIEKSWSPKSENVSNISFEKSGPRSKIYFNPKRTKAAIVTCGGICPGMNAVVRGLVRQLWFRYDMTNIVGIKYGYNGLGVHGDNFVELNPKITEDIHHEGGTILGSSRGSPPVEEMVDSLMRNNINILFTVGGDGTMNGARSINEEISKRGLNIAVIGVPKTIDNDIPYVNRSFGFETAVEKASEVVLAGHEEARGHLNGIGLVKLMGRNAGFIAAGTVMATGVVNLCLIPEIRFTVNDEGNNSNIIYNIKERFKNHRHMLIVVAEGAGRSVLEVDKTKKDLSGNIKLPDIGLFLKEHISTNLKKEGIPFDLKYLDPSYLIRSSGPNCFDKVFCSRLAQNAVHAAMTGKTNMMIGYWHGEMTHVPLTALVGEKKLINPKGTYWFNVMESTNQLMGRN